MRTLPVKKVVVMEDRAQVERRGTVSCAGLTKVVIEGLPMVAVDRSLKVEVKGATLIDAKLERRWKEQPKGGLPADASALGTRVKTLELQKLAEGDALARLDARAEVYGAARAPHPTPAAMIGDREPGAVGARPCPPSRSNKS